MDAKVPSWLLKALFLNQGVFNPDRTVVISGPDPNAILDPEKNTPVTVSIDLTKRGDWEAVRRRLADEAA